MPYETALIAESPFDMTRGIRALYVYCDIMEPSIVGNTFAKLLRLVEIPRKIYGEQVVVKYDNPIFMPVRKKDFDMI